MLHPTQSLYQPTATEIAHVVASAKRRRPQCAARIDKAQDILSAGLHLEPVAWEKCQLVRWYVASQSHKGAYIVSGLHCPCQDSRASIVAGVRSCKHAVAVSLYMKILANRINQDIRSREIDLGILPDGAFNAYAKGMGVVTLRKVGSSYTFVDAASAIRYSLWLAAQPVAAMPTLIWAGHSVRLAA